MAEKENSKTTLMIFISLILLNMAFAGVLGNLFLSPDPDPSKAPQIGGDHQNFTSESKNASYFVGLSSTEVRSTEKINLELAIVNEEGDTRTGIFIIGTSATGESSMFTKEFSVDGHSSSTITLSIDPKSVEYPRYHEIIAYVGENNGPTIKIWENEIRVLPDVPPQNSKWFPIGNFVVISIIIFVGSVLNWRENLIESSLDVAGSVFGIIGGGIAITTAFWHYFGFIDEPIYGTVVIGIAALLDYISIRLLFDSVV